MKNEIIINSQDAVPKKICNLSTKANTNELGIDKDDYSNKENLLFYLKEKTPSFFDKFELCEYLNSGSAGVVYRGVYKGLMKKQVALKFLINKKRKEKLEKLKNKENQNQEIAISRKLHNKNITEIFAYFKNENVSFSVLEYGKHGDIEYFLKHLLKRNVLSETASNYFSKQILEGLKYIHRNKIVHMDIKPGNILIDSNLDCKITDFSISCSYNIFSPEDCVKFPFCGTAKFMAPEILSKAHMKIKDTEKIDVYSFGVTLYYLFYGDYPYNLKEVKGKDYDGILNHIKETKLIFPEERKSSELFKDFLKKILEKDYTKRLTIKQCLDHPWIKASQIIFDEKEKINSQENFLISLITDNFQKFNEYLK